MKNTIKLTALALLISTGLFAATSAKANVKAPASANVITVSAKGVIVKVDNSAAKSIVMIYDKDGNVIRKDILSGNKGTEKAYVLNQLDYGDYTMEVTSNKQVVKKAIHVYDEDQTKTFIVSE
jgi:hypothetical protein